MSCSVSAPIRTSTRLVEGGPQDELKTVWEDGHFVKEYTFAEVRTNLGHIV
jgi:hypothetical protein